MINSEPVALSTGTGADPTVGTPTFTVVSAVYNVARFLPDFIRSIDSQSCDPTLLQVIMVDDGSTDESLLILEDWARRRPDVVRVMTKTNGGQGSARNLGMSLATGDWITFIDPDDWVNDEYFDNVARFIGEHPNASMVATNLILFEEAVGYARDNHPLRRRFTKDQLVDLANHTEYFTGSAPAAFFRRDIVELGEVTFDTRIRPNFEDGHFCCVYLLLFDRPTIGFLKSAEYFYRKRADQSSTLQNSVAQTGRYREVPELGYLDALERGKARFGRPPIWMQNLVLYDLSWYFSAEERPSGSKSAAQGEIGANFVALLRRIASILDVPVIESFSARKYKIEWRDIMLHALRSEEPWHTPYVVLQEYDRRNKMVKASYRYTGTPPVVEYFVGGDVVEPEHSKIRDINFFGQALLFERIAWIPIDGTLRVCIGGQSVELRQSWPDQLAVTSLWPSRLQRSFATPSHPRSSPIRNVGRAIVKKARTFVTRPKQASRRIPQVFRQRFLAPGLRRLARVERVHREFGDAWVLVDRIHECNDSAEVLFRHLRTHRPDINAWFVLDEKSDDWDRLHANGSSHIVAHGTLRWKLLMLNCRELISSHADGPIVAPPAITRLGKTDWRFTFLQHGVIKDDLSKWLNDKRIDTFITSTNAEYQSIAGDHTPYVFTSREVQLTGLPRFDALFDAAHHTDRADTILIAPTWRHWLNEPHKAGVQRRTLVPGFRDTEFARRWNELLGSERLSMLAASNNLEVVFLPHPNLEAAISEFNVPSSIRIGSYSDPGLHQLYARAFTLITDFSSAAFNCAFLGRQAIYYFFDHDRVMAGGHVGNGGYFDYYRDGFGPLVDEADDVMDELERLIANGGRPSDPYAARIESTFPPADGRCSERVTAAIEAAAGDR